MNIPVIFTLKLNESFRNYEVKLINCVEICGLREKIQL